MNLPPIKMYDVQKVLLCASPTKADGTPDEDVVVNWASSAEKHAALEVVEGTNGRQCYARPQRGRATITVSALGYEKDTIAL